jgi:hypothetical protein
MWCDHANASKTDYRRIRRKSVTKQTSSAVPVNSNRNPNRSHRDSTLENNTRRNNHTCHRHGNSIADYLSIVDSMMSAARFDATDPRLPQIAKSASSVASAIKKYFAAHAAYPPNLPAVKVYLPPDCQLSSGGHVNGWEFVPTRNAAGFSLFYRLSNDRSLEYQWDGVTETWTFHPGDGGPNSPIIPAP